MQSLEPNFSESLFSERNHFLILGFDDYMNRLDPAKRKHNGWFRDYWQDMFDCNVVDYGDEEEEVEGGGKRKGDAR